MTNLYNLSDGNKLLNQKKKLFNLLVIIGVVIVITITLLTIFLNNNFVMVLDMVLSFLYMSIVFVYNKLIKKCINEEYHMLAKIQHFDHEVIEGSISYIDEHLTTINTFETHHLIVNGRSFYVDSNKIDVLNTFKINQKIKAELVDNMLVAFEVINDD